MLVSIVLLHCLLYFQLCLMFYDISFQVDHEVTGSLLKEVNNQFAILELSNGCKALLAHSRVWINDKVP